MLLLLHICNKSFLSGKLSTACKHAQIHPILKHNDPKTFRPISLLRCLGKTLERNILTRHQFKSQNFTTTSLASGRTQALKITQLHSDLIQTKEKPHQSLTQKKIRRPHHNYIHKCRKRSQGKTDLTDRQATVKFLVTLKTLNIFADQINRKASQDPIAIFTDGSVNSKSGYSGAAIHFSSQAEARRLSYNCSILLTELSSINKALSLALSTDHTTIHIFADTFSGIQALNKPPEDNLALITNILFKMKSLQNCGSLKILNWISSDIGIDRIEAADIASSKATHYQRMNYQIPPSCIQLKRIKQNIHLTARNLQVVWVGQRVSCKMVQGCHKLRKCNHHTAPQARQQV